MATTTNYGWDTPDDTDLVKDGAAAIRTLGSSIDTTTKNLNPETTLGDLAYRSATANVKTRLALGTAGQVLRVNSGGNAPEWATTADQTPLTTKGDVFTFSTVDARLGVGANGTVLTADSAEATGLKWAAPAAASYVGVSVYKSANQAIENGADVALTFNSENFDTDSFHSTSTNTSRLTIPSGKGGKYLLSGAVSWGANNSTLRSVKVYKNGSILNQPSQAQGTNDGNITPVSNVYELIATDYLEVYVRQNSGGSLDVQGGTQQTTIQLSYLGA